MKINNRLMMFTSLLAVTVQGLAQPRFIIQPTNQVVAQGFDVTFRALATTASPPLRYQWYFNSNAIPWALTNTLTITNALVTNAGEYFAIGSDSIGSVTSKLAALTVMLPASLDPKLSANIRLGDDPAALPSSRRAQTETFLARSWTDPSLLIATCMEGSMSDAALDCSYSVSTNGGLTWSARGFIPKLTALSGGAAPRAGDAVAAIDSSGNLFVTTLTANFAATRTLDLFISKSSDVGKSFSPPRSLFHADVRYWADKEGIAINTFPDSPTFNRIAVAFTSVDDSAQVGPFGQIVCTYSDDEGATWSRLTPAGLLYATYAQPFFFRDGSLAILYERVYPNTSGKILDECVISKDGGGTFGVPTLGLDLTGLNYKDSAVAAYSDFSGCSDRQAGVLYTTLSVLHGPPTNQVPRILFTKSIDRGQSWAKPIPVNDTPAGKSVFQPTIAASPDGQHVTIGFYDKRNSAGHDYLVDYYLAESFDGGDTWEPNLRLSEFTIDLRKSPFVGDGVWIGDYQGFVPALDFKTPAVATWIDTRSEGNDPYAVRINRTRGTTFDTWRKLRFSTNDLANAAISGEQGDPDGDTIPNLAEYALGLEPSHPDLSPLRASFGIFSSLAIEYERLAVLSDVRFTWQSSSNLKDWTPVAPQGHYVVSASDPSMERVGTLFNKGSDVGFFRLTVERIR